MHWFSHLTLAQSAPPPPPPPGETGPDAGGEARTTQPALNGDARPEQPPADPFQLIWFVAIFFVIMWLLILLPQRREKKKHATMLEQLKKGDRVQTVGGVLGTVIEVRDREVLLKVDEANNTRMRFTRAAIQGVISEEAK